MSILAQQLLPGIVGISTYVDYAYHREMQLTAVAAGGARGPINQLKTVTATLDFNRLLTTLRAGRREEAEDQVAQACEVLAAAGCDYIVVTSGTTSTLTAHACERISLPFLDLAAACWRQARPAPPVGILCTSYAATGGIFQAASRGHGMPVIFPTGATAARLDAAIFDELVCGRVSDECLRVLGAAIEELAALGAASVILGNTDMTLAAENLQKSTPIPLIDAARAHARDAAHVALTGRL